jgi:hypothetical protein
VEYEALRTEDADVAINPRTFRSSDSVRDRLKAFNFEEQFSGDDRPPVTHYGLGRTDAGFYAEFLTPLVGSEKRRDGSPDVTERVAGVVAQKLRHLEVLLVAPWSVTATNESGFALSDPASLLIPSPATYLVQKLLIHDRRKPADRAKDVLYVHDTLELFAASLSELREVWRVSVSPTLHARTKGLLLDQRETMFGAVTDTIREAALMATPRRLTPAAVQELCKAGLERLFGSD